MTPRQELEALIDVFTPRIRDAFLAAIFDIVDNVILEDVVRALRDGNVDRAFQALGFSEAAMRPMLRELEEAYETGGVLTGKTYPRFLNTASGRAVFRFNVRNSRAEAYLRDKSSGLVSNIERDVKQAIQTELTKSMKVGDNPRVTALNIIGRYDSKAGHRVGGMIGLAHNQIEWVENFGSALTRLDPAYKRYTLRDERFDPVIDRAIREGKPLSAEDVTRMMTRYKDGVLRYRGETIARTESMQALNASEYEAARQVVDLGAVPASNVRREWDATGDKKTRHSHHLMDGQTVGLEEPFVSPVTHARLMYPGDTSLGAPAKEVVACRCRQKVKINWLADEY